MEKKPEEKISRNVILMGLVSFFNDFASEMVYPIIPIFLTTIIGAPVSAVGLIEGVAESTASLLKMSSGWFSDKFQRRKPFITTGYSLSSFSKLLLALAFSWPFVLLARFVDRAGKGVRTSARDALIVESSHASIRGKSFGFHRSLDTLGAVLGPLVAIALLNFSRGNLRQVFFWAFIPGIVGVLLLVFFVKEKKKTVRQAGNENEPWKIQLKNLDPSFKIFLLISFVFALGNSSDAFLILRSQDLGLSITLTILAYVVYNVVYAVLSTPAGIVSDAVGPRRVLFSGFIIFALVYFSFAFITQASSVWILFAIYGAYIAFTDGVGKAYVANLVPEEKLGIAYGTYQASIGICSFFASLIAGILWTKVSVAAPFLFGAAAAVMAAILFVALEKRIEKKPLVQQY
jgi:MFS family permease